MATFPATPVASFPINKTQNPKTRTVTFADGYEHRITFGLAENQNPKVCLLYTSPSPRDRG